jgi:ABC-type thiamin/hydroxymethylpyrimidine transport system permease subunit
MDEQVQEDWLDARLREEAPYIDDAGFTARIVRQLPARRQSNSLRGAILLAVTFVASVLAYFISDRGGFLADSAAFLVAMPVVTLCVIAICCGLLVTALGASAALSEARAPRS